MANEVMLPQSELDKVTEAVCQGLNATKEVQSNLWGDMQKKFANIERILADSAEATEVYRRTVDTHMTTTNEHIKRVEPIIESYEEEKAARKYLEGKGLVLGKWAAGLAALSAVGAAILYVIRKFI